VALIFLLLLAHDRELMGSYVNRLRGNLTAIAIVVFISLAGGAYAVDSFLQTIGVVH
jgi:Mn2+/Fe2+ NRAMP family transporter